MIGYVTTGGDATGIRLFEFDPARGSVRFGRKASSDGDIGFLAEGPDGRCLYAATSDAAISPETSSPRGLARAYRIDPKTGDLDRLNEQATHGSSPCYLAVAGGGRALLVANFREFGKYGNAGHRSRGSLCVLPVRSDGSLGPASDVSIHEGHSVHPDRQTASHPHGIHLHPGGRWLAVCDLGTDKVYVYELSADARQLIPAPAPPVLLPQPTGPRHLAFHPNGRFAYAVSETRTVISALAFDAATGMMERINEAPAFAGEAEVPASGADIQVHPSSGRFLFASIRGKAGIAVCRIDAATGRLAATGFTPMPGCQLDEIRIVPGGGFLLVACSEGVVSYRIDAVTGALSRCGVSERVPCGAITLLRTCASGQKAVNGNAEWEGAK